MATLKKPVTHFINEYEAHLRSIRSSISRVEEERNLWLREQQALLEKLAGTPIIADMVVSHSPESWEKALIESQDLQLQNIRNQTETKVASLVKRQQAVKEKSQEVSQLNQNVGNQILENRMAQQQAEEKRQAAKTMLENAVHVKSEFPEVFNKAQIKKWARRSGSAPSPLYHDYSTNQPWWSKPVLLAVINPERAENMKDAASFEAKTGKSLYAAAQKYNEQRAVLRRASAAVRDANKECDAMSQVHQALVQSRETNETEIQRLRGFTLPETGSNSVASQAQRIRSEGVETAAKYCVMNNVTQVGELLLILPDIKEHAALAGKLAALQSVTDLLSTITKPWRKREDGFQYAVTSLSRQAMMQGDNLIVSQDISSSEEEASLIHRASLETESRFKAARTLIAQSTPFTSQALSNQAAGSLVTGKIPQSNDSAYWMMAWITLLTNSSADQGMESSSLTTATTGATQPRLDPVKFSHDFENANGGLGLNSAMSLEDLSIKITGGVDASTPGLRVEENSNSWMSSNSFP